MKIMKKILTIAIAALFVMAGNAQTVAQPRTVNVSGSAEMEIIPDEIYVQVDLREYDKKNFGKVDIEKIKNEFLFNAKSIGLSENEISVQGYSGYDQNYWYYRKNKKNPDLKASISYIIKLRNVGQIDQLVTKLDDEATQNFYIQRVSHSKIQEYKQQLKIQAIKSAKTKAQNLAEAIGEKVGQAITINEPNEVGYYPRPVYANTMMKQANAEAADASAPAMNPDWKKMKLQFDVHVTFALQ
jgi:uncharacterized protein